MKKADAAEAKEEAKPVATTDRSALDSTVLPTSTPVKVELRQDLHLLMSF